MKNDTDLNTLERQVDWMFFSVFPRVAVVICAAAGIYFVGHLAVALIKGWL